MGDKQRHPPSYTGVATDTDKEEAESQRICSRETQKGMSFGLRKKKGLYGTMEKFILIYSGSGASSSLREGAESSSGF